MNIDKIFYFLFIGFNYDHYIYLIVIVYRLICCSAEMEHLYVRHLVRYVRE